MHELVSGTVSSGLAELIAAQAKYLAEVASGLTDEQSDVDAIAEVHEREAFNRRMAVLDHDGVNQLTRRGLPARTMLSTTAAMLQDLLRISPYEAKRRVDAAALCAQRISLAGELLPPLLPILAEAQRAGEVSADHVRVIRTALHRLPDTLPVSAFEQAERDLVAVARSWPPREVAAVGERIRAHLDPDGVLTDDRQHRRLRAFYLHPESDGSYTARGRLTPQCGAKLTALLTAYSAPAPQPDAAELPGGADANFRIGQALIRDDRTHPQRVHDALEHLCDLASASHEPTRSGAPTEVIITLTADQLASRQGFAESSFGQLLTVDAALAMADEAAITLIGQTNHGAVLCLGRTRRIASRKQTLALIARDRGCSFPSCTRPPSHCQRHHIVAWVDGGRTDITNLTFLCDHHHREFGPAGWRCRMIDGLPHWIPPRWLDPRQTPQLNHRINRV